MPVDIPSGDTDWGVGRGIQEVRKESPTYRWHLKRHNGWHLWGDRADEKEKRRKDRALGAPTPQSEGEE